MPTKLLFRENPYRLKFEARVSRIDGRNMVLDQTCFYPQGGGQVGDAGEIDGIRVVDTRMDEDQKAVIHVLESEPNLKICETIHGCIDWNRRYRIMRLHSAAHIVYYLMQEVYGGNCKPVSSGLLDEKKDRSDYVFTDKLDKEKLEEVERRANEVISKNHEIKVWGDKDNPHRRYWKIDPFPVMACGGTHVKNTEEIGRIIVKRGHKPGRGKERIEILLA